MWPSGSRSTICGAEGRPCCMCTCVCVCPGMSLKYASLSLYIYVMSVRWPRWPRWPWRGKVASLAAPPKVTSSPSFIVAANPCMHLHLHLLYCNSPIANILHMYTGKIMLSFCPDIASSTDPSPMIIPYPTTLQKRSAGAATTKSATILPKTPRPTRKRAAPTQTPQLRS